MSRHLKPQMVHITQFSTNIENKFWRVLSYFSHITPEFSLDYWKNGLVRPWHMQNFWARVWLSPFLKWGYSIPYHFWLSVTENKQIMLTRTDGVTRYVKLSEFLFTWIRWQPSQFIHIFEPTFMLWTTPMLYDQLHQGCHICFLCMINTRPTLPSSFMKTISMSPLIQQLRLSLAAKLFISASSSNHQWTQQCISLWHFV